MHRVTTLVVYLLIALVQGQGYVAAHFSTASACDEDRAAILELEDVLMVSECLPITISPAKDVKRNAEK